MAPIENKTFKSDEDLWEDTVEEVNHINDYSYPSLSQFAKDELGEDEITLADSLTELLSWVQSQPHLTNCRTDSNFLLRFLRMQKHKVEKSSLVLEKYLTMRCSHPKWFQNLDIQDPLVSELVHNGYIFVLPERDQEGRRVIFSVARNLDPARHSNSDAMRAHLLTFETSHWDARKLFRLNDYQSDVFVEQPKQHKNNQQMKL